MLSTVLLTGLILFFLMLVCHVVWWRIYRPRQEGLILGFLFVFIPSVVVLIGQSLPRSVSPFGSFFDSTCWTAIWLLTVSLGGFYVIIYPAFQAVSPTLRILICLWEAGETGLSHEDITGRFAQERMLDDRVNDLVREDYAQYVEGRLAPTTKGLILVYALRTLRWILGLPPGEG